MTFTTAHNYQRDPIDNGRCSPNLRILTDYILTEFGGQPLGCYGKRPIRGGSSPSTHWSGAAVDIRYANVGAGYRNVAEPGYLIGWIIDHHQKLGIQQLHDYVGARIWKVGRGWKAQATSPGGMGQSWAQWLHLEVHPSMFDDTRPIPDRTVNTPPPVTPQPEVPPMSRTATVTTTLDVLQEGATGRDVQRLQGLLAGVWFPVDIDGHYGPQTAANVMGLQRYMKLTADGIVGPQTWKALLDS